MVDLATDDGIERSMKVNLSFRRNQEKERVKQMFSFGTGLFLKLTSLPHQGFWFKPLRSSASVLRFFDPLTSTAPWILEIKDQSLFLCQKILSARAIIVLIPIGIC